ncbi:MAG: hypothetical protein R8K22_01525 [Mariprofundaceae bacterium]
MIDSSDYIFLGIFFWALFVTSRLAVFALRIDIAVKKKIWPILIMGLGLSMFVLAYLLKFPPKAFYILMPIVALIIIINLRGFSFCLSCERMVAQKNLVSPSCDCPKCGKKL